MIDKITYYYKNNGFINTVKWLICKPYNIIKKKININKCINSKSGNIKDISKIKDKKVFIFAGVPYFDIGGGQRSSQLAKEFNKLGYDVIYIYNNPSNESKIYKLDFPTVIHKYIKKFSIEEFESLSKKNDIIIFEIPSKNYIDYLNSACNNKLKIVYENIDNWESLSNDFFDKNILKEFLLKSNLITATARPLKDQIDSYLKEFNIKNKKVIYLANAVNDELFNPNIEYSKPDDLVLGSKTFIYYGSLWGSWFDWKFIEEISSLDKNYIIYLIGDDRNIDSIKNRLSKNVKFLGLKKQSELPAYLKYVDYALLPFKTDTIGNYVSPLKIFEYISMNKNVLATALPDIKGYPNTYFINDIKELKHIIKEDNKVDINKRNQFIKDNNWNNRVLNIIKELEV